jgi:hypothetical protein
MSDIAITLQHNDVSSSLSISLSQLEAMMSKYKKTLFMEKIIKIVNCAMEQNDEIHIDGKYFEKIDFDSTDSTDSACSETDQIEFDQFRHEFLMYLFQDPSIFGIPIEEFKFIFYVYTDRVEGKFCQNKRRFIE